MKIKSFTFLIFFHLIFYKTFSQVNIPILIDSLLVEGIYYSFEEFKQNNPSKKEAFSMEETKEGYRIINTKKQLSYFLNLNQVSKINMKNVWGFCDGENVYRKQYSKKLLKRQVFNRIEYYGRYCYFTEIETINYPVPLGASPVTAGGLRKNNLVAKVINMNNGKDYFLKQTIEMILERDEELYAIYKSSEKTMENLKSFLIQYCEKHPEELQ